jgi:hypothetical protein
MSEIAHGMNARCTSAGMHLLPPGSAGGQLLGWTALSSVGLDLAPVTYAEQESADETAIANERATRLRDVLVQLDEKTRSVLLRNAADVTLKEIGAEDPRARWLAQVTEQVDVEGAAVPQEQAQTGAAGEIEAASRSWLQGRKSDALLRGEGVVVHEASGSESNTWK